MFSGKKHMGRIPESLRMYILCKHMKWTHLPCGGGIYDQHPKLLDDWLVIMNVDAESEAKRQQEMERKTKASSAGAGSGRRARGRRGR